MNKRKILVMAMALAMCAILVVGGTLAYFTDVDQAENVFTFGNIKIQQNEQQRELDDETGKPVVGEDGSIGIEAFDDYKNVFPAVHNKLTPKEDITVDGYDFQIRDLDGNYVDKIVNVTNVGTEEAYIRTIIAIPNMNGYDDKDPSENPLHWNYLDATDFKGTGWDWNGSNDAEATEQDHKIAEVTIDEIQYDLYVATYNAPVAAGATTSPSLVGFYLDNSFGCDDNGYFSYQNGEKIDLNPWIKAGENGKATMKILVATQACQTEGFDDAWEALDTAFGEITKDNHPWDGKGVSDEHPWDGTYPTAAPTVAP